MNTALALKKYRLNKGVSQLDLELAINASTGTISRIENGRINPTKETLFKIAEFLELDSYETLILIGVNTSYFNRYIPSFILNQKFFGADSIGSLIETDECEHAFYKGKDYFIKECDNSLNTDNQEVLYVHSIQNWRKVYKEEYANTYHVPIRIEKRKFAKFLMNDVSEAYVFKDKDSKYFRQTKVLSKTHFDYNLMILNDSVTLFLADPQPLTLTLKNKDMANKFKGIFNNTWKS